MNALFHAVGDDWHLTTTDLVIVTHNAANVIMTAQLDNFKHIQCFAHILQWILHPLSVSPLLRRIRWITTANCALEEKKRLLQLPLHKLKTDVAIRWNNAFHKVDRFLKQQPAICAALLSSQVRKSAVDVCTLTQMDISKADYREGSQATESSGHHHVRGEDT